MNVKERKSLHFLDSGDDIKLSAVVKANDFKQQLLSHGSTEEFT